MSNVHYSVAAEPAPNAMEPAPTAAMAAPTGSTAGSGVQAAQVKEPKSLTKQEVEEAEDARWNKKMEQCRRLLRNC